MKVKGWVVSRKQAADDGSTEAQYVLHKVDLTNLTIYYFRAKRAVLGRMLEANVTSRVACGGSPGVYLMRNLYFKDVVDVFQLTGSANLSIGLHAMMVPCGSRVVAEVIAAYDGVKATMKKWDPFAGVHVPQGSTKVFRNVTLSIDSLSSRLNKDEWMFEVVMKEEAGSGKTSKGVIHVVS